MTCPCGLTEDFDCPECVADMDQPLCYLDPMIDDFDYNAPHEWELIENPWVLVSEDEYRNERY